MRWTLLAAAATLLAAQPTFAQSRSLGITATQNASAYRQEAGKRVTLVCPPSDGKSASVYGTDVYTDDSSICASAIHAGVLKPQQAGVVSIDLVQGSQEFRGSQRNGVTSRNYGRWDYAFKFASDAAAGNIGWAAVWAVPPGFTGNVVVACPAGGKIDAAIWGTDVYTTDSAICVAAVHAGVITASTGGVVAVQRAPALSEYPGTTRRGVVSRRWGALPNAFTVKPPVTLSIVAPGSLVSSSSAMTADPANPCALTAAITQAFAAMKAGVTQEYATLSATAQALTTFNAGTLTTQKNTLLANLGTLEQENTQASEAACAALRASYTSRAIPRQDLPTTLKVYEPPQGFTAIEPPVGPPPADFIINGTPGVAEIRWISVPGARNYRLHRSTGPNAAWTEVGSTPNSGGPTARQMHDTVPDPRVTYQYRLRAEYQDGSVGEAVASWLSPLPINPTNFRAQRTSATAVRLDWDPRPGAVEYRIDGTGLPITGMTVTTTTATLDPQPGDGSWQLVALFPGAADYDNRPTAAIVAPAPPPLPSHAPAFLSKSAGVGSATETAAHYDRLCNWTADSAPCRGIGDVLVSWGVSEGDFSPFQDTYPFVQYQNVTDLGAMRETRCLFGQDLHQQHRSGNRREYGGPGPTICYTNSGKKISLIVMYAQGALFGVFERAAVDAAAAASGYDESWPKSALRPTAEFDSEGPKFAPHVCLSCHGGTYDPVSKLVKGASLLPIDPSLVQVQANRFFDHKPVEAEEKIRRINSLIRQRYSSPAIAAYIEGLYGGFAGSRRLVDEPGTRAMPGYVPPGWGTVTERRLYLDFVKKDCAMCHLAGPQHLNFLSANNMLANKNLVHAAVCGARSMPHAEVPFKRFWTSRVGAESGPKLFAAALGFQSC